MTHSPIAKEQKAVPHVVGTMNYATFFSWAISNLAFVSRLVGT